MKTSVIVGVIVAMTAPVDLPRHDSPVSFRNIWVHPLTEAAIAQDLGKDVK